MARINKELVAMNLLTCPTSKEAAEKSGISVPTLYRLKKDTAFQNVLQEVKDNIFGETMHKAQGYCLESLEVLRTVIHQNEQAVQQELSIDELFAKVVNLCERG